MAAPTCSAAARIQEAQLLTSTASRDASVSVHSNCASWAGARLCTRPSRFVMTASRRKCNASAGWAAALQQAVTELSSVERDGDCQRAAVQAGCHRAAIPGEARPALQESVRQGAGLSKKSSAFVSEMDSPAPCAHKASKVPSPWSSWTARLTPQAGKAPATHCYLMAFAELTAGRSGSAAAQISA